MPLEACAGGVQEKRTRVSTLYSQEQLRSGERYSRRDLIRMLGASGMVAGLGGLAALVACRPMRSSKTEASQAVSCSPRQSSPR